MQPLATSQTRRNILAILRYLNVRANLIFSEDPADNADRSRVKAIDDGYRLGAHILANPDKWSEDHGDGLHNKHGIKIRHSFRSRTTPSVQVCIIAQNNGDLEYVMEIDIDEYSPAKNLPGHAAEVLENAITHGTTDPAVIARSIEKNLNVSVERS